MKVGGISNSVVDVRDVKNVYSSRLGINFISPDEVDPFSSSTFKELADECSAKNMTLHVCAFKENGCTFACEASRFLESFLNRNLRQAGSRPVNPSTRNPVSSYEVFSHCPRTNEFKKCFTQQQVETYPNYLQILVNDPSRSNQELSDIYIELAYKLSQNHRDNIELALKCYERASALGNKEAEYSLFYLKLEIGRFREALDSLKKYLENNDKSAFDLIYYATHISDFDLQDAYAHFLRAASLGNQFAIANLILCLEGGFGVRLNMVAAAAWRTTLPEEWQSRTMSDYIAQLVITNYDKNTIVPNFQSPVLLGASENIFLGPAIYNLKI